MTKIKADIRPHLKVAVFSTIVLVYVLLTGCGAAKGGVVKGACSNQTNLLGSWYSVTAMDTLTFYGDCTGTRSACGPGGFLYSAPVLGAIPTVVVSTNGSSGGKCAPAVGNYSCAYNDTAAGYLTIDCGLGAVLYYKL